MAGLVPATHVSMPRKFKGVDGRDEPGHDEVERSATFRHHAARYLSSGEDVSTA